MRAIFCRHYFDCLDRAARENVDKMPCHSCEYRHDTDGKQQITSEDPAGCRALIVAIFAETYHEHHPHTWRNRFIEDPSHREAIGSTISG